MKIKHGLFIAILFLGLSVVPGSVSASEEYSGAYPASMSTLSPEHSVDLTKRTKSRIDFSSIGKLRGWQIYAVIGVILVVFIAVAARYYLSKR